MRGDKIPKKILKKFDFSLDSHPKFRINILNIRYLIKINHEVRL